MQRLAEQVDHDEELAGISFDEFRDFCLFLNNLDDFQIAMRMYTLADKAIAPGKRNVHSNINLKKIVAGGSAASQQDFLVCPAPHLSNTYWGNLNAMPGTITVLRRG